MDAQFWDERYRNHEHMFSGNPNGVLVTEAAGLPPGRALDVGCGEGGDAIWLARRGWRVTAVDISQVALDRAAAAYTAATGGSADGAGADGPAGASGSFGGMVCVRADLTVDAPPAGPFDLVSVHYLPLPRTPDHAALRRLLDTVAPGGTFLFAGHDLAGLPPATELGIDPTGFYQPHEIAALLDDGWTVLVDETRPRTVPAPPGTHHTHDTVLLARRVS
ncbi:class I SAM-dependent methyltransferase [Virgisporangium aurantiacum]|uniref:Methyltransferase n=1 Tax=Virgisporangium aurantiacum TaxID=175570 RepID=A0A8J4E025_9ACTN|nr:class I SAM-dependent methyltransferase [Virgisporangium aurantiacum]GIJ56336.1 methyltransferase [Virgisporangium aurantiacum]